LGFACGINLDCEVDRSEHALHLKPDAFFPAIEDDLPPTVWQEASRHEKHALDRSPPEEPFPVDFPPAQLDDRFVTAEFRVSIFPAKGFFANFVLFVEVHLFSSSSACLLGCVLGFASIPCSLLKYLNESSVQPNMRAISTHVYT